MGSYGGGDTGCRQVRMQKLFSHDSEWDISFSNHCPLYFSPGLCVCDASVWVHVSMNMHAHARGRHHVSSITYWSFKITFYIYTFTYTHITHTHARMRAHTACVCAHVEIRRQLGRPGFLFPLCELWESKSGVRLAGKRLYLLRHLAGSTLFFETGSIAEPRAPWLSYNSWLVTLIQGILLPLPSQSCAGIIVCAQFNDWFF